MKEEVVTLTDTIETNLWQGDLETKVATETESNEALSEWEEGRIIDFLTGKGLWFAACDSASQKMFPHQF